MPEIYITSLEGLSPTDPIVAGDVVRSYSFPDDPRDHAPGIYIEGTVESIGAQTTVGDPGERYCIRVDRDIYHGIDFEKTQAIGTLVYPPVNGRPIVPGNGVTNGVYKILYTAGDNERYTRPDIEAIIAELGSALTVEQLIERIDAGQHPTTIIEECRDNNHFDSDPDENGLCPGCGLKMQDPNPTQQLHALLKDAEACDTDEDRTCAKHELCGNLEPLRDIVKAIARRDKKIRKHLMRIYEGDNDSSQSDQNDAGAALAYLDGDNAA